MFSEHWDGSEAMDAEIGVMKEKKKLKVPEIKSRGGICRFRTDPLIGSRLDPYLHRFHPWLLYYSIKYTIRQTLAGSSQSLGLSASPSSIPHTYAASTGSKPPSCLSGQLSLPPQMHLPSVLGSSIASIPLLARDTAPPSVLLSRLRATRVYVQLRCHRPAEVSPIVQTARQLASRGRENRS